MITDNQPGNPWEFLGTPGDPLGSLGVSKFFQTRVAKGRVLVLRPRAHNS